MARALTRDAAAVRVFPPAVPIVAILAGIGLTKLWPIDLGFERAEPLLRHLGGAIIIAAIAFAVWAILLFRRSGQDPAPWKPTPAIVARGPYRITRNPMYLTMVFLCLGFAIRRMDLWILALTPLAVWTLQKWVILPEEAYLERKFGDAYLAYKRRVRRWL
ncbi:MAG: isoprenylcysteine carboxylmethyltransferase family protein [bacterium]|nr:isoprenylcysteine carboxylmethyltransferase family protein [bacterium]